MFLTFQSSFCSHKYSKFWKKKVFLNESDFGNVCRELRQKTFFVASLVLNNFSIVDNIVAVISSGSDKYEQAARAKIRELEGRQSQMDHVRHEDREKELQEQARRDRQMEDNRMQRQMELDAEQQKLAQKRMVKALSHEYSIGQRMRNE